MSTALARWRRWVRHAKVSVVTCGVMDSDRRYFLFPRGLMSCTARAVGDPFV